MDLNKIKDLANQIILEIDNNLSNKPNDQSIQISENVNDETQDWRNETGFPKIKKINGINYMLRAPLNPVYEGSASNHIFGGQDNTYISDPGGIDGKRSPWGLPMMNNIVLFGGSSFINDQAVKDYLSSREKRDAELDKIDKSGFSPYNPDGTPKNP